MYSFPNFEPVLFSISGSKCCFFTCIQISQEVGQVVWYFQLLNFPQFAVIHLVKVFRVVNEAEVDIFLEFSCFPMIRRCWQFDFLFLFLIQLEHLEILCSIIAEA